MSKLSRNIGRSWRAPGRYGFFWALVYMTWAAICLFRLRVPPSVGNILPVALARIFTRLGIDSILIPANGVKLYIDPRSYWSVREYVLRPHYDLAEITAVKITIPPGYTFIDVGANFGLWSFSLSGHFSRVLGVEPDPRCYQCCERTRAKANLTNVLFDELALAEEDGDGMLFASKFHIGDSRTSDPGDEGRINGIPVQLMSFESLVNRHQIDTGHMFIKLDAQGAEPAIVRGMKSILSKAQDVILFTEIQEKILMDSGSSADEYMELLRLFQFVPVDLFNGLTPTSLESVRDSLGTAQDYCFRLRK